MGTSLTGVNISSSYLGLLKSTDSLAISTTAKTITDGAGNDLPIKLSTNQMLFGTGSASVPALSFNGNTSEGFYIPTDENIGVTIAGSEVARFLSTGLSLTSSKLTLSNDQKVRWTSDDVYIQGTTSADNIQLGVGGATQFTFAQTTGMRLHQYGSGNITGTVTQRLGVTSSGQVVEIPIGGGAVDGSGTAGKIVKWSDTDTITDSLISESGSTISINGTVDANSFTDIITDQIFTAGGSLDIDTSLTSRDVTFSQGSNTLMTIKGDATGIGIGTTSPNAKLEISDSTNDNLRIGTRGGNINIFSVNDAGATAPLRIEASQFDFINGDATFAGDIFGNDRLYLGTKMALDVNGTDLFVGSTTSADHNDTVNIRTNDDNRVVITDTTANFTGNVGIAHTSTPDSTLDVRKNDSATTPILTLRQLGAGDSSINFQTTTSPFGFNIGVDGSDSDAFKIAVGLGDVGTDTALTIDTSKNATFAEDVTMGKLTATKSGTAGVFNSGTTNVVASFTSTDATGVIQLADNSGNVEIGASGDNFVVQPAGGVAQLTVGASSSTFAGNVNIENASTPLLTIKDTTNNVNVLIGSDDTNTFIRGSSGSVFLQTNGSNTAMTLDSSQRVGIGSTSVDAKLDITQSSATEPVLRLTDSGVANYDYIFPDSSTIKLETSTSSDKTFKLLNAGSGSFDFEVGGDATFAGIIGVNGSTTANVPITATTSSGYNDVAYFQSAGTNIDARINLLPTGTANGVVNSTANSLVFQTSGTERARIDSSGNLLVAKTSANNATVGVELKTDGSFNPTVNGDTVARFNRLTSDGEILRLQKDTTTVGTIGTQNWGIGTSSPSSNLHVSGSGDRSIAIQSGTSGSSILNLGDSDDIDIGSIIYDNSDNSMRFTTNASEKLRVTSAGNVGIGVVPESTWYTGGQARALQIGGTVSIFNLFDTRAVFSNNYYLTTDGSDTYINTDEATQYYQEAGQHIWKHAPSGTADTTITWTESMKLDSSGNMLLGSASAFSRLTVSNGANTRSTITISDQNTASLMLTAGASQASTISVDGTHALNFNFGATVGTDGGSTRMTILNNGNVGLGVTNPSDLLSLATTSGDCIIGLTGNSGGDPEVHLDSANDRSGNIKYSDGTTLAMFRYSHSDIAFKFYAHNQTVVDFQVGEDISFFSTSDLGIGTTSPSKKLSVNAGSTSSDGIIVTGSSSPAIHINETSGTVNSLFQNDGANSYIGTSSSHPFNIRTNNSVALTIDTSQNSTFAGAVTAHSNITVHSSSNAPYIDFVENADLADSKARITMDQVDTNNGQLLFSTEGSGTLSERARITSDGDFLVGTTSAVSGNECTISGRGSATSFITLSPNSNFSQAIVSNGDNLVFFGRGVSGAISGIGTITCTSSSTSYNTTSDYRLKEDLKDFNALEIASKIKMYDFKWKADDTRSYGVMAHELQEVVPQAVSGDKDDQYMQQVDYSKLVPILLKSIQELKAEIDELKKEI